MYNILVCDDEEDIVSALEIYLSSEGYGVIKAYNGEDALCELEKNDIHLVLMDIMMPGTDGITAVAKLRERYNIPVIFLTAKGETEDKILGLNIGGDDYITKPFSPSEVTARVRSQIRRYAMLGGMEKKPEVLYCGGIEMNDCEKTVTLDGDEVALTPIEYNILRMLMLEQGKVFTISEIYKRVWKDTPIGSEGSVPVHIRHLREKLEIDPSEPRYIKVVWGHGYKLEKQKKGVKK